MKKEPWLALMIVWKVFSKINLLKMRNAVHVTKKPYSQVDIDS